MAGRDRQRREHILSAAGSPEDDPLARERDRVMSALSILAFVFLVPFAIHDFMKERTALAAAIVVVVAVFGVDGYAIRRGRKPPIPYGLLLVPITAAITLSLAIQGVIGAFWCYPVVLFFFFVLPRPLANVCSAALLIAATALVYHYLTMRITVRFGVSLFLTIVMVNVIQNIIRELQRRLLEQAITDPLTGAFNRRHMGTRLAEALEPGRPRQAPSALLLIDVDHFKRINDELGHEAGDAVLKGIVAVVRSRSRATDQLFRMGGEEFILLLPETRESDAVAIADDIRQAIASSSLISGHAVTASIGVGVAEPQDSVESWIKATDAAMYMAKESGRNRVARRGPVAV
jgi:diguanylate cyclase (GGDEF)-like protein